MARTVRVCTHYQQRFSCNVCGREFLVDINSVGSLHQFVAAVTCRECAERIGGSILAEGIVEEITAEVPEPGDLHAGG